MATAQDALTTAEGDEARATQSREEAELAADQARLRYHESIAEMSTDDKTWPLAESGPDQR